jgi:hypothetical protein
MNEQHVPCQKKPGHIKATIPSPALDITQTSPTLMIEQIHQTPSKILRIKDSKNKIILGHSMMNYMQCEDINENC